jgi:hypothetical protein
MEFPINRMATILLDDKRYKLIFFLFILLLCQIVRSDDIDGLVASVGRGGDMVNNLISTVLASSASERAKLAKFKSENPNKVKLSNNKTSIVPNIQIPDTDVLEVSSKFPKDYLGKYVYGTVYFGNNMTFPGEDVTSISFYAKNLRGFLLETKDEKVIQKLLTYQHGDKFLIPRECPLKIHEKAGINYFVRLPFESLQQN